MNIVETEFNVDLSGVESMKLQGVSIDIPSVFNFMTVWHEILEVLPLEVDAFTQLCNISKAFYLLTNEIGKNIGSLLSISPFCLGEADDLLLLHDQQISRNLSDLAGVEI